MWFLAVANWTSTADVLNVVNSPCGGAKKLKNESFCTVFITVRLVPRPLCFCTFFTTFTVTFLPFFQSIVHLAQHQTYSNNVCYYSTEISAKNNIRQNSAITSKVLRKK